MAEQLTATTPVNDGETLVTVRTPFSGDTPPGDGPRYSSVAVVDDQVILFYFVNLEVTQTRQVRVYVIPSDVDVPYIPGRMIVFVGTIMLPTTPPQIRHVFAEK